MSTRSVLRYWATERMSDVNWEQFMTFMIEEQRVQQEDARELRKREKEAVTSEFGIGKVIERQERKRKGVAGYK